MKIAIVGPIPRDSIYTYRGEHIEKYGCVTHPVIALAKLIGSEGTVIPISHINQQDRDPVHAVFRTYPNIDLSGLYTFKDQGTIIELHFVDQNNRIEKQLSKMAAIGIEEVAPFLDVDCFVFVPITDFEIPLETLKFIKQNSRALIIFDAHGPTTYVDEQGKRLRKYWEDKKDWLPYIDVLKMNLEESQCSWYDKDYSDETIYNDNATDHLPAFAQDALNKGLKQLYITLDSRGCKWYRKEKDSIIENFIPSMPVREVIDTTGCGDSFAGGLAYGFIKFNDGAIAGQYANILGALRTQGSTFEVFKDFEETEKLRAMVYHKFSIE